MMAEMQRKEWISKNGVTRLAIVSPTALMTPDEREKWLEEEWKKGNPVLKAINNAAWDCMRGSF